MIKKYICFILSGNIEKLVGTQPLLFKHFAKVFEDVFFLDVSRIFTAPIGLGPCPNTNATSILPPKFKIISPKSLSECKKFLKSHDLIAIHFFSEEWHDWYLYYYLKKYSIPLVYIHTGSHIVQMNGKKFTKDTFLSRFKNKLRSHLNLRRLFKFFISHGFFVEVDTILVSNKKKAKKIKKYHSRFKEITLVNSKFYDQFLITNYKVLNDYVVFLDSSIPYHVDQKRMGFIPCDSKVYYEKLNRVLDIIESILGKEAVVCLHPNYDNINLYKDFKTRKAFKYRTEEFVAKAELVLFHDSTAINTAIVYGKKIIQLSGSYFSNLVKANCEDYQKLIPFTTLDIYEDTEKCIKETIKGMKLKKQAYNAFLSTYIIASGQKNVPSCVQVANKISQKYGVLKNEKNEIY